MLDILIRQGNIIDGTGQPKRKGNIGIKDGRIVFIDSREVAAKEIIEAESLVVAPGFIDIHSHSDVCSFIMPESSTSKLYQGITLEIGGNCGISCLPVDDMSRARLTEFFKTALQLPLGDKVLQDDTLLEYEQHIASYPPFVNIGLLIGHGTLRGLVVGMGMEKATLEQLNTMCSILDRELSFGAFGMSLGLIYPPSSYGDSEEIIALSKVIKKHNAMLTVHLRSENDGVFEAVDEMLAIAKATGVHLQISHLKLMGKKQWGRAEELLAKLRRAREDGIYVTSDQYPYMASSTGLSALVPKWAHAGGAQEMCKRLQQPDEKILLEITEEIERRGGSDAVLIVGTHGTNIEFEGLRLSEISERLKLEPANVVAKILVAAGGGVDCCYFSMTESDVLTIMKEPYIAVGSDGYAYTYDKSFLTTNPHPRSFGSFPKYFEMVREHNILSLEQAVAKATGVTADILGLSDRGFLKPGYVADIVVFDYHTIRDNSTYVDSIQKPKGIEHVIISGQLALTNGKAVKKPLGKLVKHE